jgi:hypothetical protein
LHDYLVSSFCFSHLGFCFFIFQFFHNFGSPIFVTSD